MSHVFFFSRAHIAPRLRCRRHTLVAGAMAAMLLLTLLFGLTAIAQAGIVHAHSPHATTLSVCPTGPPACDYADLQAAIDAAAPGDEIVVAAGTYSGSVTLRSQLTIRGDALDPPVLTAARAPVVAAHAVDDTTLAHVIIDGRSVLSAGLVLHQVDITLEGVSVMHLRGRDGTDAARDGEDAVALALTGNGRLIATALAVTDVRAGGGYFTETYPYTDYAGGDALAVDVAGPYSLTVRGGEFEQLYAGNGGVSDSDPYWCGSAGGSVWGIRAANSDLRLEDLRMRNLRAGTPCVALANDCLFHAGVFRGIALHGGSLTARNLAFTDIGASAGHDTATNIVMDLHNLSRAALDTVRIDNRVFTLGASGARAAAVIPAGAAAPDSPFCVPPPLDATGIAAVNVSTVEMRAVEVLGLHAHGYRGIGRGMDIRQCDDVSLRLGRVEDLNGGFATGTAVGVEVTDVQTLLVNGLQVRSLRGGHAPGWFYYAYTGNAGGSATGIALHDVADGTLAGNSVWNVRGGHGSDLIGCSGCAGKPGGDATGMHLDRVNATLAHNTVAETVPGAGGLPAGADGASTGIAVVESAATMHGTIVAAHETGIRVASGAFTPTQTVYWQNMVDVDGTSAGSGALYLDPAFMDAPAGDLHLRPSSPLIDAGAQEGASWVTLPDFDGQLRPADGDGDGVAALDLGADEFYVDALVAAVTLTPSQVAAGEPVTVALTLLNAGPTLLESVGVTGTWDVGASFVPGSLTFSAGDGSFMPAPPRPRVLWAGELPVAEPVVIRFRLDTVAPDDVGLAVGVYGAVTTPDGAHDQQVQATLLVNPRRVWLPMAMQ